MPRRRTTSHLFALLGLALTAGACNESDSILLIEVAGPVDLQAVQLHVVMSAGGVDSVSFGVPATPLPSGTISFPASFTVALDRSHTAPIMIEVDAIDATMSPLAAGTTTQQHIEIGGQTVIPVFLTDVQPPNGLDGGTDASTDAAGSGAAGSGGGGADGAAGSGGGGSGGGAGGSGGGGGAGGGGAAGADGGVDLDDAGLGLDGDTD